MANIVVSVASLAELKTVHDTAFGDGGWVYVTTLHSWFMLAKSSSEPFAPFVILATRSGVGRWMRIDIPSPVNALQATWHINFSTGSDEATGATAGTALKTAKELFRRIGTKVTVSERSIDINIDFPILEVNGDSFDCSLVALADGKIRVNGKVTILLTGTLSSVVEQNPVVNQSWEVAAPGLSAFVGCGIRIVSGPNRGAMSTIAKDLGADRVRLCTPVTWEWAPGITEASGAEFRNGDLFEVVALPQVDLGSMTLRGSFATQIAFSWVFLNGSPTAGTGVVYADALAYWIGCRLSNLVLSNSGGSVAVNTLVDGLFVQLGTYSVGGGGCIDSSVTLDEASVFIVHGVHGAFTFQNSQLWARGRSSVDYRGVATFDCDTPLLLTDGASGKMEQHSWWGTGNRTTIIRVLAGSVFSFDINPAGNFFVTGSGPSDFILDRATSGPTVDPVTFAVGPAIPYTFANLISPTGFNGNAVRPTQMCGIVSSPGET